MKTKTINVEELEDLLKDWRVALELMKELRRDERAYCEMLTACIHDVENLIR